MGVLFIRRVEVLVQDLGHGEHVDFILLEHRSHRLVAYDLTLVFWILKIIGFDMLPESFHCLWSR